MEIVIPFLILDFIFIEIIFFLILIHIGIKAYKRIKEEILLKEKLEENDTESVVERVTRRDINGDYGFRNPLSKGYRINNKGQYIPVKPNSTNVIVEEDEDV